MRAFQLKKKMPAAPKGTVFVWDNKNESLLGSPACGCLILAWDTGSCQEDTYVGAAIILPGQMAMDSKWFEEIPNPPVQESTRSAYREHRYYVQIKKQIVVDVS